MRGVVVKLVDLVDLVDLHIPIHETIAFLFEDDMSVTSKTAVSLRRMLFRKEPL